MAATAAAAAEAAAAAAAEAEATASVAAASVAAAAAASVAASVSGAAGGGGASEGMAEPCTATRMASSTFLVSSEQSVVSSIEVDALELARRAPPPRNAKVTSYVRPTSLVHASLLAYLFTTH